MTWLDTVSSGGLTKLKLNESMITIELLNPAHGAVICFAIILLLSLGSCMQPNAPSFFQGVAAMFMLTSVGALIISIAKVVIRSL